VAAAEDGSPRVTSRLGSPKRCGTPFAANGFHAPD
jgi:hypothetical protein